MNKADETAKPAALAGRDSSELLSAFSWNKAQELPPRSRENSLRSIKVLNQDGDSVYYSFGHKEWQWWISVNTEEEPRLPLVTHWTIAPRLLQGR